MGQAPEMGRDILMTEQAITDFHAHFFARPFFDALAQQSPLPGTPEEKLAAETRDIKSGQSRMEKMLERLLAGGGAAPVEPPRPDLPPRDRDGRALPPRDPNDTRPDG